MAKTMTSYRLAEETRDCLARLCAVHGYPTATDALADAVASWERALSEASAAVAGKFSRAEWSYLADMLNGTLWPAGRPTGAWLALEASDAHRLNGLGGKWLVEDGDAPVMAGKRAKDLVAKLAALPDAEAAAVARATAWFWQHSQDGRVALDSRWWDAAFRASLPPLEEEA